MGAIQQAIASYGAGSSLLTDLVAFWKFNNNGNDSIGSNNLTGRNSPTFTTGKIGEATVLAAGLNSYWDISSNADLQMGDIDWSVAGWFMLDTNKDDYRMLVTKEDGTNREYLLYYNFATDRFSFEVLNGSSTSVGVVSATSFGSPSLGVWYFLFAYHSATNNQVGISVNDGTVDTAATTGAPGTNNVDFVIGSRASHDLFLIGKADAGGLWKKQLSVAEVSEAYNSNNGWEP